MVTIISLLQISDLISRLELKSVLIIFRCLFLPVHVKSASIVAYAIFLSLA